MTIRQPHLAFQTRYTRTGERNMLNRKPYRTKAQKELARASVFRHKGAFCSNAPVSFHSKDIRKDGGMS